VRRGDDRDRDLFRVHARKNHPPDFHADESCDGDRLYRGLAIRKLSAAARHLRFRVAALVVFRAESDILSVSGMSETKQNYKASQRSSRRKGGVNRMRSYEPSIEFDPKPSASPPLDPPLDEPLPVLRRPHLMRSQNWKRKPTNQELSRVA
jgi:hypothetical protein